MKKIILVTAVLCAWSLTVVQSHAKGQSARATCLARVGVTEQQWQGRKASYAQGAFFKSCMTEHGLNVTVRRRDGSILY